MLSVSEVRQSATLPKSPSPPVSPRALDKPEQPYVTIPQLFEGKTVLVTGATGFLGKALVEKIVRCCPGVKRVNILLRPKGNKDIKERFLDFITEKVFDRIRRESPDNLCKVKAMSGDVTKPDLGLQPEQLEKVLSTVTLIFHCAANVRFDQKPREALETNVLSVKHALDLCERIPKLDAVVFVSSAYSFCNLSQVGEDLHKEVPRPEEILESMKSMSDPELEKLCQLHLAGRPSVYHLSKALAEALIYDSPHLPVVIVRPSIITAAWKDPFPGWVDTYNGPSGLIALCGKGVVRSVLVQPKMVADWVPVDIVVNTLLEAAHLVGKRSNPFHVECLHCGRKPQVLILNCCVPQTNCMTWLDIEKLCLPNLQKYPPLDVMRYPGGSFKSCWLRHRACQIFSHFLPALMIDVFGLLLFRKPRMIHVYRRIHSVLGSLEFFTNRNIMFYCINMRRLTHGMVTEDRVNFETDFHNLYWPLYVENYVRGVKKYVLKEGDETLPEAKKNMIRRYYMWLSIQSLSTAGLLWLAYKYRVVPVKLLAWTTDFMSNTGLKLKIPTPALRLPK